MQKEYLPVVFFYNSAQSKLIKLLWIKVKTKQKWIHYKWMQTTNEMTTTNEYTTMNTKQKTKHIHYHLEEYNKNNTTLKLKPITCT